MKTLLPLPTRERKQLFKITAATPRALQALLRGLPAEKLTRRPAAGFSLHEHVCHLADLEREFERRFQRLLTEAAPALENFDGDAVAVEGDYHSRSLTRGLRAFADTRLRNLWLLSGLSHADWMRRGSLAGVGALSLADVFRLMAGHDQAHLAEIRALLPADAGRHSSTAAA